MRKVLVDKDLLYKIYIEENHNIQDTAEIMNLSYRVIQRAIKDNHFNKDKSQIQQQRRDLLLNKYGVENTYQLEESKKKAKETKLNKYGSETYNNSKQQKQTMIDKYGVSCGYRLPEVQEKILNEYGGFGYASPEIRDRIIQTNQSKYNVDYPTQNEDIKLKAQVHVRATMQKRYGVSHNFQLPDIRDKIKISVQRKYGVPYFCMREECYGKNGYTNSKINQDFAKRLKENNIEFEQEYHLENKSFDFKIGNTLVEINPTYTHNSTNKVWFHNSSERTLDTNYHIEKTKLALKNNFRCIHIWDWDNIDKVLETLKLKESIQARKCYVQELSIDVCSDFINEYHLQGNCKGQNIRLGLFYNNDLVQVMTFGKPRYNRNFEYELLRLCTKPGFTVIGGSNKLFNYFLKQYNPKSIISYCDNSKFIGNVYSRLGFKLKSFGEPSKHWYSIRTKQHITDNLLRQRGFDQLFGAEYGKGTSNEELMKQHNFVEIYDAGQSTYTWNREEA